MPRTAEFSQYKVENLIAFTGFGTIQIKLGKQILLGEIVVKIEIRAMDEDPYTIQLP